MTTTTHPQPTVDGSAYVFDLTGGEKLVKLRDSASYFERLTGHRPHLSMIRRLARRSWLPLPTVCVGNVRYTSVQALAWWVGACTAARAAAKGETGKAPVAPLTGSEQATLARFGLAGQVLA